MLKFITFILKEAAGDITARQGHANEFFTNDHGKAYAKASLEAVNRGASSEEAHAAGLAAIMSKQYDHNSYLANSKTKKSVATLGPEAARQVHDNSRQTMAAMAEYLHKRYNGRLSDSIWVGAGQAGAAAAAANGMKTNADLILKVNHEKREKSAEAHLENEPTNFGGSLKYSSSEKDSQSKIHSPGINTLAKIIESHHKQMFGEESGITEKLQTAREEGQERQRRSVTDLNKSGVSHHEVISDFLEKARANPKKYSGGDEKWEEALRKTKYIPISNPKTNGIHGADFNDDFLSLIRKTIRNKPKGVDHKALDEFYKHVSNKNSEMRNDMADIVHEPIRNMLRHTSPDAETQDSLDKIKESLHRHLANVHNPGEKPDQLPTMMVKTGGDGTVGIADVNEAYRQHFSADRNNLSFEKKSPNKGTFRVGPGTLTLDVRPGTMHNPLANPANYTIPSSLTRSAIVKYKNGKFDKKITSDETNTKETSPESRIAPAAPKSYAPAPVATAAPPANKGTRGFAVNKDSSGDWRQNQPHSQNLAGSMTHGTGWHTASEQQEMAKGLG